jgi:sugar phosphate isomerase/epimerase
VITQKTPGARRVGIDNYGLFPLGLTPLQTLEWARAHGADGVAFSGLSEEQHEALDDHALAALSAYAAEYGLYLEWGGAQHIPRDMTTWAARELFDHNRRAAREARALGTRIVRSCSGGLMRWKASSPATAVLLRETATALKAQRAMLRDHGVILAIETHFEFTSFELVRLFTMCDAAPGDWLGICLDTMNLLTMLEDPVAATRRLLPWVVSTHIKDGGLLLDQSGLTTFTAPIGRGTIDLRGILALLRTLDRHVKLSVEDHGGSFHLPIYDEAFLSRFPDLTAAEFARLVEASCRTLADLGCRPLDRADWPAACESRTAGDVAALHAIVHEARA